MLKQIVSQFEEMSTLWLTKLWLFRISRGSLFPQKWAGASKGANVDCDQ